MRRTFECYNCRKTVSSDNYCTVTCEDSNRPTSCVMLGGANWIEKGDVENDNK